MPQATRAITRVQDADDMPALADEQAVIWGEDAGEFVAATQLRPGGALRASGPVEEATQGFPRMDLGVQNGSPRAVLEGSDGSVWEFGNDSGKFRLYTPGTPRLTIDADGKMGVGTIYDALRAQLDVAGDRICIRNSFTPSGQFSDGTPGQIAWDTNYFYVCINFGQWKRTALSGW